MAIKTNTREAIRFAGASLFEGGGAGIMSTAALQAELSDRQQAILDKRLNQVKGSGGAAFVPVGLMQSPRIRDIEPVPSVYPILQRTSAVPTKIASRTKTPNQGFIHPKYNIKVNSGGRLVPNIAKVNIPRPPVIPRPIPTGVGRAQPTNIVSEGSNVAIDLGSIIVGLGGQYINARYPQQQNVGVFDSLPEWMGGVARAVSPDDVGTAAVADFCPIIPKGYFINDKGEVRKKPKRRRRRLATPSDIKDLAALSSVTNAPEKKTWIATHPS